jgi:8-oxo-dGTP pyrophosphatase MutT (NUDIX family)
VQAHAPATARERASHAAILRWLAWLPRPLDQVADPVHVTASAVIIDAGGTHTALHRHRRLGMWLQPGGHVDTGEDARDAAIREAIEETGLAVTHVDPDRLLHVDVHEGGRGHLHLDLRWLLVADVTATEADRGFDPAAGESQEVAWVTFAEVGDWADNSVSHAVEAAARWVAAR